MQNINLASMSADELRALINAATETLLMHEARNGSCSAAAAPVPITVAPGLEKRRLPIVGKKQPRVVPASGSAAQPQSPKPAMPRRDAELLIEVRGFDTEVSFHRSRMDVIKVLYQFHTHSVHVDQAKGIATISFLYNAADTVNTERVYKIAQRAVKVLGEAYGNAMFIEQQQQ